MKNVPPRLYGKRRSGETIQGMALIEALVAAAVLGMGLAGATRLTLHGMQTASHTRQHTVAQVLAVSAMECHQSGRSSCDMNQELMLQGTRYTLQSQLRPRAGLALVDIEVSVQWPVQGLVPGAAGTEVTAQRIDQLVLQSSQDQVPAWVGVSLP